MHVRGAANGLLQLTERSGVVTLRRRRLSSQQHGRTEVTIEVPSSCAVTLSRVAGTIRIGDIDAKLRLDLAGGVDVHAGRVATTSVCLYGHGGHISLAAVEGSALDIEVIGAGRVDARGTVEHLLVRVKGSGNVSFHGETQTADLSVDGDGHVNVIRARTSPASHVRRAVGA